jgi:hypothetical protein
MCEGVDGIKMAQLIVEYLIFYKCDPKPSNSVSVNECPMTIKFKIKTFTTVLVNYIFVIVLMEIIVQNSHFRYFCPIFFEAPYQYLIAVFPCR